jgi:outer membrane protein TolC
MTTSADYWSSDPRLRIPVVFSYLALLMTAILSGCTSTTKLRWQNATTPHRSSPVEASGDEAKSDLPKRRGRSKPRAPDNTGDVRVGDVGVVLAAAEAASGPGTGFSTPAVPPSERVYPIDLTTALRLAEIENPLIAEARQRIGEALAIRQGAMVLLLPSLNWGINYHGHTGNLQRSSGRILNLDENSLYFGGGAGAVAASPVEVPAVSIFSQLTDAIFEPLAARQMVEAARFGASATANSILLEVAELYFELLAAEADLGVRLETAVQATEVARLTRAYAQAQQGREADAERAATELSLVVDEIRQAEEQVAVVAAQLSRRLHLDQSVRVRPIAPKIEMTTIVDPGAPLPALIEAALVGRPEVGAKSASVAAAEVRHKQERYRPLLPTIWVGFSGGAFGGGSNVAPPQLSNFGGRTDFDVQLFWTLRNLGAGNLSLIKRRQAEVGQAVGERSRALAEIRTEVASAFAEVSASRRQVAVTTRQLDSAVIGFREDLERIKNTVGRPIEVVNSLELLNQARVDRIRAVMDYNKAEVRLFVSLGSPPPLGASANEPLPPAPIASPLLPPLAGAAPRRDTPPALAARTSLEPSK